ncbi:hypothetical protein KIN20_031662 [Parelaphostrongylus tenuis]|uniref:Uncharacterized protein n=1 Tax=Parelaphostrongylus tenuis TaxID=148309 RepID=A0AAD5R5Y4_PARTN|nr:hypothetical protein KIN20_031662 [Parelaphostrongylus tenuis]
MRITLYSLLILSILLVRTDGVLSKNEHAQQRNAPSAFQLARIQRDYDLDYDAGEFGTSRERNSWLRRDDIVNDIKCLNRCNYRLDMGMDMVNMHRSFGSIDVPSVIERNDLKRFCRLDEEHTQCVEECGYVVEFNLREYVCKKRFDEMLSHLACYARAAPVLSRRCRARCGGYSPLHHSFLGYALRCRQLFCDHTCINLMLYKVCRVDEAKSAGAFLLDFTRMQVNSWLKHYARTFNISLEEVYPSSCAQLQCDGFTRQCDRLRQVIGDDD